MKIIDFYDFEPFNQMKNKMGIGKDEKAKFKNHMTLTVTSEWGNILGNGLEVDLHEIEECEDGTLEHQNHKGKKIAIFTKEFFENTQEIRLKFHVTWCHQLNSIASSGINTKYIISQRPDDLKIIKEYDVEGNEVYFDDFNICKHCLLTSNYESYRHLTVEEKEIVANNFSMENFSFETLRKSNSAQKKDVKKYMTPFQEQMLKIDQELTGTKKSVFKDSCKLNEENFTLVQKIKKNHYFFEENIKELMFKEFKRCSCMIEDRIKFINDEIFFNLGYKDLILIEYYGKRKKYVYNMGYDNIYI
ncbi:hypothetical protein [Fusobacterium sp. PH5-44]|uniref:hypothetical protein n=1 Tax=unclassified Fusobacterium TaxID=2648384 RepID=UPI003D22FAEF